MGTPEATGRLAYVTEATPGRDASESDAWVRYWRAGVAPSALNPESMLSVVSGCGSNPRSIARKLVSVCERRDAPPTRDIVSAICEARSAFVSCADLFECTGRRAS